MHDLVVVGAGMAGLALAQTMAQRGADVLVLEARPRIGGRVLGFRSPAGVYDLGPAWLWPTLQPRVDAAVRAAGLSLYPQSDQGGLVYQNHAGRIEQFATGFQQSPPSMRMRGGIEALVNALAAGLRPDQLWLDHRVRRLQLAERSVLIEASGPAGTITVQAARVALALPPRLIGAIEITPRLPPALQAQLAAVPGWMAAQAKALAVYDRPFWRDVGLSGSASSQAGPLLEIHDASLPGAAESALFGFFGWPATRRAASSATLAQQVADQLAALFGEQAASPRQLILQDWATEPFTATSADRDGGAHPNYRPIALPPPWNERLHLAGAEVAPEFGGYLEGALAAAEAVAVACTLQDRMAR